MQIDLLDKGLWRLEDDTRSTAYLLEGADKALLIDCGTGHEPVLPVVKGLTAKPVELAVTHVHGDHYGAAHEFDRVYMHEKDIAILPQMQQRFALRMGVKPIREGTLVPIRGGDVLDIGGRTVRVIELFGHTPGSVVFACDEIKALFTGDALGSGVGVWMQVPCALPIDEYAQSLRRFLAEAAPCADYAFYGGHYTQSGVPGTDKYNPLCMDMARDMLSLCLALLDGAIAGNAVPIPGYDNALYAGFGRAGMVYLGDRLRA